MSNDLHQATGSMPAQPEENNIEAPIETAGEEEWEMNEMSDDIPSDDKETTDVANNLSEEEDEGEDTDGNEDAAKEEESELDPNGPDPIAEPINE